MGGTGCEDMKMNRDNAPCYTCQERKVGCHSSCDKYIIFSKMLQEGKVTERATIASEATMEAYNINKSNKIKKYLRSRKRR
jgi:hypothetical protein